MNSIPLVVRDIVNNDLCIGCGVCIQACPNEAIEMKWNEYGFLVAAAKDNLCRQDGDCIKVCPFNLNPTEGLKDEDDLAELFLKEATESNNKIGKYINTYAGYSEKYRPTSSSGGIATYVYEQLLSQGYVDHIVTVGSSAQPSEHYEYTIISNAKDLLRTSKTRYYPVTLSSALKEIKLLDGRVAISGVACFIKAIRLAQANDSALKEKIVFLVGIICGGVKSSFFTDYLVSKTGEAVDDAKDPEYRVKDPTSTANDYAFSCTNAISGRQAVIKMHAVGDMWGTGLFKANACDFCDDVTTELADISLGDAWLAPYSQDGKGHNVVVARSHLANRILNEGAQNGELQLQVLPLKSFLQSQQGSFNHRHDGLATRITMSKQQSKKVPPMRHIGATQPIHLRLVQYARRKTREKSLDAWKLSPKAIEFDASMRSNLFVLRTLTKISHVVKKFRLMKAKIL